MTIIDLEHYRMQTQSIQTTLCLTMTEARKDIEVDLMHMKLTLPHQLVHTSIVNIRNVTGYDPILTQLNAHPNRKTTLHIGMV